MLSKSQIAYIIPAYKVAKHLGQILFSIPDFIDHVIVSNDNCPQNSGLVAEKLQINGHTNFPIIYHEIN